MRPASGCPRGSQTRCAASAPCTTCTPQVAGAAPAARGARARRARRAVHHRRAHRASDRAARPARRGLPPAALRAGQRRTLADRFAAAVRVPLGHGGPRPAHSNPALVTLTLPSSLQPHTRPAHPTISALQPHAPCTLAMHPRLTHALTHARTHARTRTRTSKSSRDAILPRRDGTLRRSTTTPTTRRSPRRTRSTSARSPTGRWPTPCGAAVPHTWHARG